MASLEVDGWELVDGESAARQFPDQFVLPPHHERSSLREGDVVKLRFILAPEDDGIPVSETMRVKVVRSDKDVYIGTLQDTPVLSPAIEFGALVGFEPRHVVGVNVTQLNPRHPLYSPSATGRALKRLKAVLNGRWDLLG